MVKEEEYKGKMVLVLIGDNFQRDKYPFKFGVEKAKKILANIDSIKAFVAKYDKPPDIAQEADNQF